MSKAKRARGSKSKNVAPEVSRRSFLSLLGAGAACAAASGSLTGCSGSSSAATVGLPSGAARQALARDTRFDAAQLAFDRGVPIQLPNGDESLYASRIGNYSKGLVHNALGEPDPTSYQSFLNALAAGDEAAFESIILGGPRPLTNPQSGLALDLEGPDAQALAMPPAPALASAEAAGEIVEDYWMALMRDVHFSDYDSDPTAALALADLNALSDFRGPRSLGQVTPQTLFRGFTTGDRVGPYLSQFLLQDIPFGANFIDQRMRTTLAGDDHMTTFQDWLDVQNGAPIAPYALDATRRYIRNLRDLAEWVHVDALYQAYLHACLFLLAHGHPFAAGIPYGSSNTQIGFGTFGGPHILSLVTEVASRALHAVWYQKWFVHRRLRPEEYAGRVHVHMSSLANYPLHADVLNSAAVQQVFSRYGTYLLPMAFPEGSPTHPAYGAGHATVAGACTTILKAWFYGGSLILNAVEPAADGLSLVPYSGADAGQINVENELNKVAANVAIGRNAAGVHWRSDYTESLKLGEAVAIGILEEQKLCYNEAVTFSFTKFDGTSVTI